MALRRLEPTEVVVVMRNAGYSVPEREVAAWIHHAAAFEIGKAVIFGAEPFECRQFIALDLEYDTWAEGTPLWLAGAEVVTDSGRQQFSFWADPGEERTLLESLAGLLSDYPELPIVTWNGHSADVPQLRKACSRWDMAELTAKVESRHVDLYLYVKSSVRFPVEGLSLKLVAAQLGLVRDPSVSDGLDATAAWAEYTGSLGTVSASRLRRRLTRYNLEDVASIVELALAVRELTSGTTGDAVRSMEPRA